MLVVNGKEVLRGVSRKQAESISKPMLEAAREVFPTPPHKKAFGFSLKDRATLK